MDGQNCTAICYTGWWTEWMSNVCTSLYTCAWLTLMLTPSFAYCSKRILLNIGRNVVGSFKPKEFGTNSNAPWYCRTILILLWTCVRYNNYNLSLYTPLYLLIYYTHLSIHTANPDTVLWCHRRNIFVSILSIIVQIQVCMTLFST